MKKRQKKKRKVTQKIMERRARFFLFPRWAGSCDGDFYPQLKDVVRKLHYDVVDLMPPAGMNPPSQDDCVTYLQSALSEISPRDVLFCHSVANQIVLRYLSQHPLPHPIRLISVAGWFTVVNAWPSLVPFLLKEDQMEEEKKIFFSARRSLRSVALFVSDNDKFTPDYKANIGLWSSLLGTDKVRPFVVSGGAHFNRPQEDELVHLIEHEVLLREPHVLSLKNEIFFPNSQCSRSMSHRVALSPLTNEQSRDDNGALTDEEIHWLAMRAAGDFAMVMTAAAYVHVSGKGFQGQLGACDDAHDEGLVKLAKEIQKNGAKTKALSIVQLHHGGQRGIAGCNVGPSDDEATRTKAISDVSTLVSWFVSSAQRCQRAGFDGVEIHGAHGYILTSFLSATSNKRTDAYGGTLENRSRVIREIIQGIRKACGASFLLGLRLSVERYQIDTEEMVQLVRELCAEKTLDFIDLSLWDVLKLPEAPSLQWQSLMAHFMGIPRHHTRLGVVGKINSAAMAATCLELGADFVFIGRASIRHHDFARRALEDPSFVRTPPPYTDEELAAEGVSPAFLRYLHRVFQQSMFDKP